MKTKLIILGLLVAFAVPAFAQRDTIRSNKNEFSIGYHNELFFGRVEANALLRIGYEYHF